MGHLGLDQVSKGGKVDKSKEYYCADNRVASGAYSNGMATMNMQWMCFFKNKKCEWNITHTTGFQYAWNDPKKENKQFKLPSTHPMWENYMKYQPHLLLHLLILTQIKNCHL